MAQAREADNSMITEEMWMIVAIIIFVVAFWFVGHPVISFIYFCIWRSEMWVMSLFTEHFDAIRGWVANARVIEVKFEQFADISTEVGTYTRWFWDPLLALIAIGILFKGDPIDKFKVKHSADSFIKRMAETWPHAAIFYNKRVDIVGKPGTDNEPGLKPREFAKMHQLLNEEGELNEQKAESIFTMQLGKTFPGFKAWKVPSQEHKVAIAALCLLKFYRRDAEFTKLRNDLAIEFNRSKKIKGCMPFAHQVFDQYTDPKVPENYKFMGRLLKSHAYEYTIFYSMFMRSKRGVFAPCEFRWVKIFDRRLWYTLNSVDRRVSWVEAAAVKAHWLAEIVTEKAIRTPIIMEAVVGLKEGLMEIRERVEED